MPIFGMVSYLFRHDTMCKYIYITFICILFAFYITFIYFYKK